MTVEEPLALDFAAFLDRAVSPAHTVQAVAERLEAAGYHSLDERAAWSFEPGQRVYVTRSTGSIIALQLGQQPPCEAGFCIIGAHTDSPNLRLRPKFDVRAQGHALLSVEPYGSPLLHTWLDRDLALAGSVVVAGCGPVLIRINDAIARVSSLAVHLNRNVNSDGLKLEKQNQLRPSIALEANDESLSPLWERILSEVSRSVGRSVPQDDIIAIDLGLFEALGASFVGARSEFISSGRIDNLASCHAALQALLATQVATAATRAMVLYDHEEVGSRTNAGAQSPFLTDVLARFATTASANDPQAAARALANSVLLSADMAHAVHPNFSDKHDEQHRPKLGHGPALKTNANQAYASDLTAMATVERVAREQQLSLQRFASRNDIPCGSTIGPIAAARAGLRVADIGNPMLSMHSCRELAAVADLGPYVQLMRGWFDSALT